MLFNVYCRKDPEPQELNDISVCSAGSADSSAFQGHLQLHDAHTNGYEN